MTQRPRPHRKRLSLLLLLACGACSQRPEPRWVNSIRLRGVEAVDADEILERLGTQSTSCRRRWGLRRRCAPWTWNDEQWYRPATLDVDVQRVAAFYAARGYFRARVADRRVTERADGESVDIELTVREGQPTSVTAVTLRGLDDLPLPDRQRLARDPGIGTGQRFVHQDYLAAKARLEKRLTHAGYAYARVEGEVRVDRDQRSAEVEIETKPGPLVRFGRSRIVGNGPIPADKLYRLISWDEGDRYDAFEISRTRARLFNQRVFGSVRVELPEKPTERADVTITVEPTKLRELRLGGGLGIERRRHEVRLRSDWTWRNFLGGLRTLSARLRPAYVAIPTLWAVERHGPAVSSDLKLSQPDIFATGILAYGLVGYDLGLEEAYRQHGPKAEAGLERALWEDYLRVGLSWNLRFFDFFDIQQGFDESSTRLGLGFVDPYQLIWLEPFVRLDLRDDLLDPRRGLYAELRLEQGLIALGGAFDYTKIVPDLRGYLPLGSKRLVLALRATMGHIARPGGSESPVTQRFRLGGPTSHRGFSYGRLSPQSWSGLPLGGNAALLLSGDLRLRLARLGDNWLGLGAFFDAGDVTLEFDQLSFSTLHLAVGGDLTMQTPIGNIRVAVGVRLNRLSQTPAADPQNPPGQLETPDPGERIAFHLTIGEAF